jgi:hypothetical protein
MRLGKLRFQHKKREILNKKHFVSSTYVSSGDDDEKSSLTYAVYALELAFQFCTQFSRSQRKLFKLFCLKRRK